MESRWLGPLYLDYRLIIAGADRMRYFRKAGGHRRRQCHLRSCWSCCWCCGAAAAAPPHRRVGGALFFRKDVDCCAGRHDLTLA